MPKKILITGANSYVGTSFERYMAQWPAEYQIDTIDMIDGSWRTKSFAGYDVVFHVAGIAHVSADPKLKDLYYKINRDLAIETAEKAKREGVNQFIFMSSMIIYGADEPIGKEKIITRETKPAPADFYGDSKLQADLAIQEMADGNFIVSILRPPMIYGPGCKGNFPRLVELSKYSIIFPNIENKRSILYIDNLSEAIKTLIDDCRRGIFFPQNKKTCATTEIIATLREIRGDSIFLFPLPCCATAILARLKLANKVFGSKIYAPDTAMVFSEPVSFCVGLKNIIEDEK